MAGIIIALDLPSAAQALDMVDRLGDAVDFYKVGSPLFTRSGPQFVRELRARDKRVFLDLKFHDIPSTVANAVESAAELDVELLTLHTAGGEAMMRAARAAAGDQGPRLLGVTILTSFAAPDLEQVWDREAISVRDEVARLAGMAMDAGLHGVVSSALEVESLKQRYGTEMITVTPGIRLTGDVLGDQARAATPAAAVRAGADYLVIGRPVIAAADPHGVVQTVLAEIYAVREVVT